MTAINASNVAFETTYQSFLQALTENERLLYFSCALMTDLFYDL